MTMTQPGVMQVSGRGGQIEFDGQFLTIKREGFMARASHGKGDKRIPVRSIAAVQWKPAGAMVNGFIQFTIPGGNEGRSRAGRQTKDAAHDENSVIFTKQQQPEFETLRAAVEQAIATGGTPVTAPPVETAAGQIAQLADLHRAGALSAEEFAQAKARLLAR